MDKSILFLRAMKMQSQALRQALDVDHGIRHISARLKSVTRAQNAHWMFQGPAFAFIEVWCQTLHFFLAWLANTIVRVSGNLGNVELLVGVCTSNRLQCVVFNGPIR